MVCAKSNEGEYFEIQYTANLAMEECNITRINQSVSPGRRVLGDINYLARCEDRGNPISPTANLKLLTKVASDFEKEDATAAGIKKEDVPKKKELQLCYVQQHPDENFKSRKDKSLSSLCSKFLQLFPLNLSPGKHMMISLDQTVSNLGTERRRIYDIINVFESLQMATKVAKNHYMWYGCQHLHITLALLKGLALRLKLQDQIQFLHPKHKSSLVRVVADDCNGKIMDNLQHIIEPKEDTVQTDNVPDPPHCTPSRPIHLSGASVASWDLTGMGESSRSDATAVLDNCAERSLGVMCQKFIMLFLISSKECGAFKPLGPADPTTQPHIPEDLNSQPEGSLLYSQNLLLVVHNGMSRILGLFPFSVDSVGRHVRIQVRQRELLTVTEQPSELVNLDLAASVLLTENVVEKTVGGEDDALPCCHKSNRDRESESGGTKAGRFKTTVRRLYDIANVLTSLGLICKVQNTENSGRKPAFKYIGPSVEAALFTDQDIRLLQATRQSLLGSTPYIRLRKSLLSCEASSVQHERKQHDAGRWRMYSRTKSENWSEPRKRKAHHYAEDSGCLSDILHVAEMELKRLEHQEMKSSQKSARKKLFPRHHSETCVVPKSHQAQVVSGTGDRDLHSGVEEECLDSHTNTVFTEVRNESTFAGAKESSTLERPLKVQKIGLLHKSNNSNLSVSGMEVKVIRKLVKVESHLSKKKNSVVLPVREMNCSLINNNSKAPNPISQIQSALIADQINFANSNDATTPKLPHFKISAQHVQSSYVEETDGFSEASRTDVGSSVPKVLCVGKGVTIIEMKLPALTQCLTVPSNNSGNVTASAVGNSVLVPSQPVAPKQVCSPSGYVYQIGTGGSASGSVPGGNVYRAVQVGTVIQLVPLCNNSLSLTK